MAKMKIKKGDLVQVISGRRRRAAATEASRARSSRSTPTPSACWSRASTGSPSTPRSAPPVAAARTGGIVTQEAPVHISNVAVVDPETKQPTRVKTRVELVERDGRQKATRVRVAVRSGKDL